MLRIALPFVSIAIALATSAAQDQSSAASHSVHTEMHNVMYHYTDSISVHITQLEGNLVAVDKGGHPVL